MKAPLVLGAADLRDLESPPFAAIHGRPSLQQENPVNDTPNLMFIVSVDVVIKEQDRALLCEKELLERQDLPTIPKRIFSQHSEIGQSIDHNAIRLCRV